MGYTYRGNIRDVDDALDVQPVPLSPWEHKPFDPAKCGTYAGYKQHQNCGVAACRQCKDALAAYHRDLRARHKAGQVVRVFKADKCGTLAGYSRHVRHGVPLCDACRQARSEYRAAYYERVAA